MKKFFSIIYFVAMTTIIIAQPANDWPPLETNGDVRSLFLNNLKHATETIVSDNDIVGIFAMGGGTPRLIGQGTVTSSSNGTVSLFNQVNYGESGIADGTPILKIQLYDIETGTYHDFDLSATSPANPTLSNNLLINNNNNSVTPASALPVELAYFEGAFAQDKVGLSWATLSEENNDYFVVEKSIDGKTFEALTTIQGAGTTIEAQEYSYTDGDITAKTNYYRLKQVDFDETFAYSDIIVVEAAAKTLSATSVTIYPNPVINQLNIQLPLSNEVGNQADNQVTFMVMDLSGKVVLIDQRQEVTQDTVTLDVTSLNTGSYILQIESGSEMISKRIMIQH